MPRPETTVAEDDQDRSDALGVLELYDSNPGAVDKDTLNWAFSVLTPEAEQKRLLKGSLWEEKPAPAQDDVFVDDVSAHQSLTAQRRMDEPRRMKQRQQDLEGIEKLRIAAMSGGGMGIPFVGEPAMDDEVRHGAIQSAAGIGASVDDTFMNVPSAIGQMLTRTADAITGRDDAANYGQERAASIADQHRAMAEAKASIGSAAPVITIGTGFGALAPLGALGAGRGVLPAMAAQGGIGAGARAIQHVSGHAGTPDMPLTDRAGDIAMVGGASALLGGLGGLWEKLRGSAIKHSGKFRSETPAGQALAEGEALGYYEITPGSVFTNAPSPGKAVAEAHREVREAVARSKGKITSADPVQFYLHKSTEAAHDFLEKLRANMAVVEQRYAPKLERMFGKLEAQGEALKADRESIVAGVKAEHIAKAEASVAQLDRLAAAQDVAGAQAVFEELKAAFPTEMGEAIARHADDAYRAADEEAIAAAKVLLPRAQSVHGSVVQGASQSTKAFEAADAAATERALDSMTGAVGLSKRTATQRQAIVDEARRVGQGTPDDIAAMRQVPVGAYKNRETGVESAGFRDAIAKEIQQISLLENPLPGAEAVVAKLKALDEMLASFPEGGMSLGDSLRITKHLSQLGKEANGTYSLGAQPYDKAAGASRAAATGNVPLLDAVNRLKSMALQNLENVVTFGLGLPSKTSRFDTDDFFQLKSASEVIKKYGDDPLITEALDILVDAKGTAAPEAREALTRFIAKREFAKTLDGSGFKQPAPGIGGLNADSTIDTLRGAALKPGSMEQRVAMSIASRAGVDPSRYNELAPKVQQVAKSTTDIRALRDQVQKYKTGDALLDSDLDSLAESVPGLRKSLDEAAATRGSVAGVREAGEAAAAEAAGLAKNRLDWQQRSIANEQRRLNAAGIGGDKSPDTSMREAFVGKDRGAMYMKQALRKAGLPAETMQKYGDSVVSAYEIGGREAVLEKVAASNTDVLKKIQANLDQALKNGEQSKNSSTALFNVIRNVPEIYEPLRIARMLEIFDKTARHRRLSAGATFTGNGNIVSRISPHMEYRMEALRKVVGESDTAKLVTTVRQLYDIYTRNQGQE